MYLVLIQAGAFAGKTIFAQAEGSSSADFFNVISSITVTASPLVRCVKTSLLIRPCARTFTCVATTVAGPGTSGTVLNSSTLAAGFAATGFFTAGFFTTFFLTGAAVFGP